MIKHPSASTLSFFPDPLPDELVYSMAVRYHHLSANYQTAQTREELFGSRTAHLIGDFPAHLGFFAKQADCSPLDILRYHTVLDLFRPFISPERITRVESLMLGDSNQDVMSALGIQAGLLHFPAQYRRCPSCAAEDIVLHGIAYLHVQHHFPGVYVCATHNCLLEGWARPRKTFEIDPAGNPMAEPRYLEPLLRIAGWCNDIFAARCPYIDPEQRIAACRVALPARNFVTTAGHLRLTQINEQLQQHWDPLLTLPPFDHFSAWMKNAVFPRSLLYKPHQQFHPIKHIILLDFLFGSWAAFLAALDTVHQGDQRENEQKPIPTANHGTKTLEVLQQLQQGSTLSAAACQSGISIARTKAIAIHHGIPFQRRRQKMTARKERAIWRKLFIGWETEVIAHHYRLSSATVEQLLLSEPQLVMQRKKIRRAARQQQHRNQWQRACETHPTNSRSQLRNRAPASYTWLYRNDRPWLQEHLPQCQPAHRPKRTSNTSRTSDEEVQR